MTADSRAGGSAARDRFRHTATLALDVLLEADPVLATTLGDHRYDDRLADLSPSGVAATVGQMAQAIGALDDLDNADLDAQDAVDLELLRSRLTASQWGLADLAEQTWNPLESLPGNAIYSLIARDTGEPAERLRALTARLEALPQYLTVVRDQLSVMPRVHVETAEQQARGAISLLTDMVDDVVARASVGAGAGGSFATLAAARSAAVAVLEQHARWLHDQLPHADRDPRLGERAFAAKLWYTLDTQLSPDALLDRAESDLMAIEDQMARVAALLAPQLGITAAEAERPRAVLDALAAGAPVSDVTVLDRCRTHLADLVALVRQNDLVSVPDDRVEIIEMPEAHRGVAVAYCDPPGPLEPDGPAGPPPTFFAVAPTPADWPAERVASFYREYNDHMLRNLSVHEAMPGHVLQLAHARRFTGTTPVRAALWSGVFVEGWAVYAEQLVADLLEDVAPGEPATHALRMQQLKMQLRTTINAILDVRVHGHGMTQDEAMSLMTSRGHQEEGEAAGKWRRALLTSTQLSTYYVGFAEVSSLAADLRAARPGASRRDVHDQLLAHGSPSPRLLRPLVGLTP